MTTRDAEDVGRPDVLTPSNTTPTQPKRHARLHRGVDVLPSSSFKGAGSGGCSATCRSSSTSRAR